jgi:hypothetical protein
MAQQSIADKLTVSFWIKDNKLVAIQDKNKIWRIVQQKKEA